MHVLVRRPVIIWNLVVTMVMCTPGIVRAETPGTCVVQEEFNPSTACCLPAEDNPVQSFTPQTNYRLQTVEVKLNFYHDAQFFTVYLQDGPSLSATVLRSLTVSGPALGPAWYSIDFPDIDVQAGTTYYLRVSLGFSVGWWEADAPSGYPNGTGYINGVEWDGDYLFRVCGQDLNGDCAREESCGTNAGSGADILAYVTVQSFSPLEWMRVTAIDIPLVIDFPCTATLYLQDGPETTAHVLSQLSQVIFPTPDNWQHFDLPDVAILQGTTYYMRMQATNSLGADPQWSMVGGDVYPRGNYTLSGIAYGGAADLVFRVCGQRLTLTAVEEPTMTSSSFFIRPAPNPALSSATLKFQLPQAEPAFALDVYDIQGRLVRHLLDRAQPAGPGRTAWDLRSDLGRPVSSGIYYIRLRTRTFTATKPLIVVR